MSDSYHCHIFVGEDEFGEGVHSIQFQLPPITITFAATDFLFAERILSFVDETRGNPAFRDIDLGGGRFRCMPEKSIDLSSSFQGVQVVLLKDGEYDATYILRVFPHQTFAAIFHVYDEKLDAMLDSLHEVVDDWCDNNGST